MEEKLIEELKNKFGFLEEEDEKIYQKEEVEEELIENTKK